MLRGEDDYENYFEDTMRAGPVSYTHLDVYKRQGKDASQFTGCSLSERRRDKQL